MQQVAELPTPQALDAEQGIIAAVVLAETQRLENPTEPDAIAEVDGDELTQHFHGEKTRRTWGLLCDRHRHSQPNDLMAIVPASKAAGVETGVSTEGGIASWADSYLRLQDAGFPALAKTYAKQIREASLRRRKMAELGELRRRLAEDPRPLGDWYAESTSATLAELDVHRASAEVDVAHEISALMDHFGAITGTGKHEIPGIRSGIGLLDWMLGGFRPGHVTVIAGRPAQGKTALALTITLNVIRRGRRVGFISCEMTAGELIQRLVSQLTGIEGPKLWRGPLERHELRACVAAMGWIKRWPLSIVDSHKSWPTVANDCARLVGKGADLLVIDYLGLLTIGGKAPRWEEVGRISGEVKAMAKRLKVPVILLAQINREVKGESEKRPQLWHLRDSGAVEQDADEVLMVHRAHQYDETKSPHEAELLLRKNRHGPEGKIECTWNPQTARFADNREGGDQMELPPEEED